MGMRGYNGRRKEYGSHLREVPGAKEPESGSVKDELQDAEGTISPYYQVSYNR